MAKVVKSNDSPKENKAMRPALTPEAREQQLIYLATQLAEQQLIDGTASSQVITHYLKLGSTKERIELEKQRADIDLLKAKVEAIKASEERSTMYAEAIAAMRKYSGNKIEEDDEEEYGEEY